MSDAMSERMKRLEAENLRLESELDDALGMIDDLERGDGARAVAQAAELRANRAEADNARLEVSNERFKEELEAAAEKAQAVEKELALLASERDAAEAQLDRVRRDLAARDKEFDKYVAGGCRRRARVLWCEAHYMTPPSPLPSLAARNASRTRP